MPTYSILDVESNTIIEKGAWSKAEAITRANALAQEHGKAFDVVSIAVVYHATKATWSFDL